MKIYSSHGELLEAEIDLSETYLGCSITLHSNGGASRGKRPHNPAYIATFELLLQRLRDMGAKLNGAWVVSKDLMDVPLEDRLIRPASRTYPIDLGSIDDIRSFRLEMRRSVSRIGASDPATPGTGNKKILLSAGFEKVSGTDSWRDRLIGRPMSQRASKYDALHQVLASATEDTISYSLDELDAMVGGLPGAATNHQFWATVANRDDSRPQQRAWRQAGFKASLRTGNASVTFARSTRLHAVSGYWVSKAGVLDADSSRLFGCVVDARVVALVRPGQLVAVLPVERAVPRGGGFFRIASLPVKMGGVTVAPSFRLRWGIPQDSSGAFAASRGWAPTSENNFAELMEGSGHSIDDLPLDEDIAAGLAEADNRRLAALAMTAAPTVRERISKYVERGRVGEMVKAANGYRCQICEGLGFPSRGFVKRNGVPYVEAHHVIHVSTLEDDVLGPSNVISACANHHRELHFGSVSVEVGATSFIFTFSNGQAVKARKFGS